MTAQLDLTQPISAAMLEAAGACHKAIALVRQHFGSRRLRLTRARLRKAARLGLRVSWLADHLPLEQGVVYNAAEAAARRVYDDAVDEARRVFNAALAESRRTSAVTRTEAWLVFCAADAEAWRVFYDVTADALADALGLP